MNTEPMLGSALQFVVVFGLFRFLIVRKWIKIDTLTNFTNFSNKYAFACGLYLVGITGFVLATATFIPSFDSSDSVFRVKSLIMLVISAILLALLIGISSKSKLPSIICLIIAMVIDITLKFTAYIYPSFYLSSIQDTSIVMKAAILFLFFFQLIFMFIVFLQPNQKRANELVMVNKANEVLNLTLRKQSAFSISFIIILTFLIAFFISYLFSHEKTRLNENYDVYKVALFDIKAKTFEKYDSVKDRKRIAKDLYVNRTKNIEKSVSSRKENLTVAMLLAGVFIYGLFFMIFSKRARNINFIKAHRSLLTENNYRIFIKQLNSDKSAIKKSIISFNKLNFTAIFMLFFSVIVYSTKLFPAAEYNRLITVLSEEYIITLFSQTKA